MVEFTPLNEEFLADNYKGGEGWVVVAVGEGGRACVLAVDPGLGALRWLLNEMGLTDPDDELGLGQPEDPGVYRATVKAVAPNAPTPDEDFEFVVLGEWEDLLPGGFDDKDGSPRRVEAERVRGGLDVSPFDNEIP